MKAICFSVTSALTFVVLSSNGAPRFDGEMRDAASHDQLSSKLRMAQQSDPIRDSGPAIGEIEKDPASAQHKRSLLDSSAILCFRGKLTLVPKRAVLHVPEHLENRFGVNGKVEVKSWQDFYAANRGWIRPLEVTRDEAFGFKPLSEAKLEAIKESTTVVVATFKNGPIAVRPYVDPAEEAASSDKSETSTPPLK
jgi:hypothetical protein